MTTLTIPIERHREGVSARTWRGLLLLALIVTGGLALAVITARHDARAAEQRACAAELRVVLVQHPALRLTTPLADPCATLKAVRG